MCRNPKLPVRQIPAFHDMGESGDVRHSAVPKYDCRCGIAHAFGKEVPDGITAVFDAMPLFECLPFRVNDGYIGCAAGERMVGIEDIYLFLKFLPISPEIISVADREVFPACFREQYVHPRVASETALVLV